jgi:exodeoxyribonuclease VII small subunit
MSEALADNRTFEEALAALDQIVRELEDGHTGLEDSLSRYEMGVGLLKRCYAQLCEAEQRILTITGVDEEGRPIAHPFEHAATAEPTTVTRATKPRHP